VEGDLIHDWPGDLRLYESYLENVPHAALDTPGYERLLYSREKVPRAVASVIMPHEIDDDPFKLSSSLGMLSKGAGNRKGEIEVR
jgi:hypothetical protein